MADRAGVGRHLPCPDCGSPVRPDHDQLCPTCGYPLMFLRPPAEGDARAVPRSPDAREDNTGMVGAGHRIGDTRRSPGTTYGGAAPRATPGQLPCPACGYGNEAVRIRCERCGYAMRVARPQAIVLKPPPVAQPSFRWPVWLIVLIVLTLLYVLYAVATVVWDAI